MVISENIIESLPIIPLPNGMSIIKFLDILVDAYYVDSEYLCVRMRKVDMTKEEYHAVLDAISDSIDENVSLGCYMVYNCTKYSYSEDTSYAIALRDAWITKNIRHYTEEYKINNKSVISTIHQ